MNIESRQDNHNERVFISSQIIFFSKRKPNYVY